VGLLDGADEEAVEVLEGARKARSDDQLEGKPTRDHSPEDAMAHTERCKGVGGAGKPDERLRRVVKH
jgi:hypothetical protein